MRKNQVYNRYQQYHQYSARYSDEEEDIHELCETFEDMRDSDVGQQHQTDDFDSSLEVLQKIYQDINVNNYVDASEKHEDFINDFVEKITDALTDSDKVFEEVYDKFIMVGSFDDDLKIDRPNEFDLDIIIKFPFRYRNLEITTSGAQPGCVRIGNFETAVNTLQNQRGVVCKTLLKWCDEDGFLMADKIRTWFFNLVKRYISRNQETLDSCFGGVKIKGSGPATTLVFKEYNLSLDLVPALEFQTNDSNMPPRPFKKLPSNRPCYAVPKPVDGKPEVWHLSFPHHESDMIYDKKFFKPTLKLIKKLRDSHGWEDFLASYYIKTVFMWELKKNSLLFNENMGTVFLEMLDQLCKCLQKGEIKSFWDPRHNLLEGRDADKLTKIARSITHLYNRINKNFDSDPDLIYDLISPQN